MKIIANLLITRNITTEKEIEQYSLDITSYIRHVDTLYIYNVTKYPIDGFYENLKRYDNVEYATCEDLGEVQNYQRMYDHALSKNADFCVCLELGYFYEESVFNTMKRYISETKSKDIAIYTPLPLYGCQMHERKGEDVRYVQGGCNLTGTFVNMHIYKEMNGFKKEYYQSMFDYEYCIRLRQKGYKILLFNNEVLRNENYRLVDKKIGFVTVSTYDKDPLTIYYEYRNRLYLWQEYKKIDPYYVKLDKKLYKRERHEMKWRDPGYRDKLAMFEKAKEDFNKGRTGKIKYDKKDEN